MGAETVSDNMGEIWTNCGSGEGRPPPLGKESESVAIGLEGALGTMNAALMVSWLDVSVLGNLTDDLVMSFDGSLFLGGDCFCVGFAGVTFGVGRFSVVLDEGPCGERSAVRSPGGTGGQSDTELLASARLAAMSWLGWMA